MLDLEQFNSENERICWPAILAVLAVQMIVLIALSIAVANHSSFATASSTDTKANSLKR
jgi:5-bromo-4-chloroindolyl phosphate hydrolysis protein